MLNYPTTPPFHRPFATTTEQHVRRLRPSPSSNPSIPCGAKASRETLVITSNFGSLVAPDDELIQEAFLLKLFCNPITADVEFFKRYQVTTDL
ncbi:hypothetical protein E3N88_29788 [Mikania micrantha]|uniref:Uncharacterized protein n=1 Tax=Mikania micrantha TaxID=192012 RepID=A0A5N6MJT9_9ASTR|nr:hypothetical protein E3N88_29788 [Mikania micrantha]